MSEYTDAVKQNTPRMIVSYSSPNGVDDVFNWVIVGDLPIVILMGYITRIEAELAFRAPPACDDVALVVTWIDRKFQYFVHPSIPVDALVGMLELIKLKLGMSRLMMRGQPQAPTLFGPDGNPIPRS